MSLKMKQEGKSTVSYPKQVGKSIRSKVKQVTKKPRKTKAPVKKEGKSGLLQFSRKNTYLLPSEITGKRRRRKRQRLDRVKKVMRYELANLVTHGIGAGLAIAGMVFLIIRPHPPHTAISIASSIIYGACIVLLYLSSTFYHSLLNPRMKRLFRILDHSSIFLAIAGSYTPVALNVLKGALGWWIFGAIWTIGIVGILYKVFFRKYKDYIDLTLYIGMGWLVVLAIKPTYENLSAAPLALLFAGGMSYTLGTIFYAMSRLPYHHMIWHIFVLGGSICHYIMVYKYI